MNSVIIEEPGAVLGKTSERIVIRGGGPHLELIEGGAQMVLPLRSAPRPRLSAITTQGELGPVSSPRTLSSPRRPRIDKLEIPLFRVAEIVIASLGASVSTDLVQACCERGIRISFLDGLGRPYAMLSSPMLTATIEARRQQFAALDDGRGGSLAKAIVYGKLGNQAALLKYFGKYLAKSNRPALPELDQSISAIESRRAAVKTIGGSSIGEVRTSLLALEGGAGKHYWNGVRVLLEGYADFRGRHQRDATDPVNAALNYGYGVLYSHVWGALVNAGLEPFAGFLHVDRPGKPSLVLDQIEEFRQPVVDRAVIALLRNGFALTMRGGLLSDPCRKRIAGCVLERLAGEISFHGQRHQMRSVIQMQARNLASFLRGDCSLYRPYSFKW